MLLLWFVGVTHSPASAALSERSLSVQRAWSCGAGEQLSAINWPQDRHRIFWRKRNCLACESWRLQALVQRIVFLIRSMVFMFTFSTRQQNQGIRDVLGLLLAFSADQCSVNWSLITIYLPNSTKSQKTLAFEYYFWLSFCIVFIAPPILVFDIRPLPYSFFYLRRSFFYFFYLLCLLFENKLLILLGEGE